MLASRSRPAQNNNSPGITRSASVLERRKRRAHHTSGRALGSSPVTQHLTTWGAKMELICAPEPKIGLSLVESDNLRDALEAVRSGDALAARVPNFYSSGVAGELAETLLHHEELDHYDLAPDIGKLGIAYYDARDNADLEREYRVKAPGWNRKLRDVYFPWASPVDRVHVELDEVLPSGLRLLRTSAGEQMFAGLIRVFGEGAGADPHTDRLEVDAPRGRFDFIPTEQIACNVYLRPAAEGGELAIWSWKPTAEEYEHLRVPGWYGLDRSKLPEPAVVIPPRSGDLILFSSHRVHAVLPSRKSPRVTASLFIVVAPNGGAFMYS